VTPPVPGITKNVGRHLFVIEYGSILYRGVVTKETGKMFVLEDRLDGRLSKVMKMSNTFFTAPADMEPKMVVNVFDRVKTRFQKQIEEAKTRLTNLQKEQFSAAMAALEQLVARENEPAPAVR
jgi:hypothetical protein